MHEEGLGIPVSPKDAEDYYRIACDLRVPYSFESLLNLYLTQGQLVLSLNQLEEALSWFSKAMNHGNGPAVFHIGEIYESQNSPAQALSYYSFAKQYRVAAATPAIRRLRSTQNVPKKGSSLSLG